MNDVDLRTNSLKAWVLAARPKTLTAALIPVAVACAMAWADGAFKLFPAAVCCVFAALMQIASNLINDLYDFLKGSDREDRLGPKRAAAQGWITPKAMRIGIAVTIVLACLCGCMLVCSTGLWLVVLGAACVVFAFLYTTLLSYLGLGDLLVLVFFGLVPVTATYYIQTSCLGWQIWICAVACGLLIDTLLVLNNFRDRDADSISGKRTLVVKLGARFGKALYLWLGIAACVLVLSLALAGRYAAALLPLAYLWPHVSVWRTMARIDHGRELNRVLGMTSRNMAIFALLLVVGLCLCI